MRKSLFLSTVVSIAFFFACSGSKDDVIINTPEQDCDPATSTFGAHVSPIIRSSCAISSACHGEGSLNGPAPLITFSAIKNASANIRRAVSTGTMPKTGSITAAQRKAIICWVDLGALNN